VVRDQVMRDVERCVTAMRHGATRGQRVRATWLPGSLLSGWVGATGQGRRQEITATPGVDHAV
jgi:hypothetical protein